MGYVVLAVGAAGPIAPDTATARQVAVTGAVTQMVSHGLVTGPLFLLAGVFHDRSGTYSMDRFGGLAGVAPRYTVFFAVGALASLALPGVSGFVAELQIFVGSIAATWWAVLNLAALGQQAARQLLGWSAVVQVGFLLMAPAALAQPGEIPALGLYLAGYTATNLVAFALAAAHPARRDLREWTGVARSRPASAGALAVAMLGLVGTPPTAVFAGKLSVFVAAWDAGLRWLVVLAALLTVISLAYYLRWVRTAFTEPRPSAPAALPGAPDRSATAPGDAPVAASDEAGVSGRSELVAVGGPAAVVALGLAAGPVLQALSGAILR